MIDQLHLTYKCHDSSIKGIHFFNFASYELLNSMWSCIFGMYGHADTVFICMNYALCITNPPPFHVASIHCKKYKLMALSLTSTWLHTIWFDQYWGAPHLKPDWIWIPRIQIKYYVVCRNCISDSYNWKTDLINTRVLHIGHWNQIESGSPDLQNVVCRKCISDSHNIWRTQVVYAQGALALCTSYVHFRPTSSFQLWICTDCTRLYETNIYWFFDQNVIFYFTISWKPSANNKLCWIMKVSTHSKTLKPVLLKVYSL